MKFDIHRLQIFLLAVTGLGSLGIIAPARAQHQTATVTPIEFNSALPYNISLEKYDFGAAALPTLHSYAAGHFDGKWVLISGRTNGLHSFEAGSPNNFPPQSQNTDVWVVDPIAKQSWSRSLNDISAGLSVDQVRSLTPTNNQFYQRGEHLYMTGGYGVTGTAPNGAPTFGTFDELSAIDLPGIIDWVTSGAGMAADHIRQISNPLFRVTGGAMYEVEGRTHLVFGQDFQGQYNPNKNGTYTNQVRSFDIVDDGTTLAIANGSTTTPDPNYRRRDLNVLPVIRDRAGSLEQELLVLSGVFTPSFGAWTVPVEIDGDGNPTMADPNDPNTFKQGFNGYHSAKIGLFSESRSEMHEILFGGISLQTFNTATMQVETDDALPFINDITSLVIDESGNYSQHWLGEFPVATDIDGLRLRYGANAEFFLADGIETYANGVLKLDELTEPTVIGYIFGGLTANGPHTRSGTPPAVSAASNTIFSVVYAPVPEPATFVLLVLGFGCLGSVFRLSLRERQRVIETSTSSARLSSPKSVEPR